MPKGIVANTFVENFEFVAASRPVLSLQDVISSAVQNNLGLAVARLQPAINQEDVVAAEALVLSYGE